MDALITTPEAGEILEVSTRTVYRQIEAGVLTPAQKLPGPTGHYLFRRSDVEALAQRRAEERRARTRRKNRDHAAA